MAETLLIDDRTASAKAGVSRSTWHVLRAAGKLPPAIKLGRACRWRLADVELWVEWGCPDAAEFAARQAGRKPQAGSGRKLQAG